MALLTFIRPCFVADFYRAGAASAKRFFIEMHGKKKPSGRGSQPPAGQKSASTSSRQPDRSRFETAGGSGTPSSSAKTRQQKSVREMIQHLDKPSQSVARAESPSKKRRFTTERTSSESSESDDNSDTEGRSSQPLTEASLHTALKGVADRLQSSMTAEFAQLREDLSRLHGRIEDLERHVSARDDLIEELKHKLGEREMRIGQLEEQVDHIDADRRRKDLILSGTAVPLPPQEAWTEDVAETAVTLLGRCMPDVPVTRSDIEDAFRVGKRKVIMCRFKTAAKKSVRDNLYEGRFNSKAVVNTTISDIPQNLYINENLSPYRQDIYHALLKEKAAKRLYTVFSKNCEVYCKTKQYGRKIRVYSLNMIQDILRE